MPVRVLQVIASSDMGGAERVFLSLLQGLDRTQFDVSAAHHGAGSLACEFHRYAPTLGSLDLLCFWNPRTVVTLARYMRQLGCHIVHSHLWTADVLAGCAAMLARVPVRVSTVHGSYFYPEDTTQKRGSRRALLSRFHRLVYVMYDKVIAVSESVRRDLTSRPGVRVPDGKIEVIRDGLDVSRLNQLEEMGAVRKRVGLLPHVPVISTVANFVPIKGYQWLVRAIPMVRRRIPDAVFVLHGGGETRTTAERWVSEAGLMDSVVFSDHCSVDARDVLAASDVVVVPSVSEGFGMVILEACALGKPVIATAVGGIPEILEDRRTGLLVPPRDPEAIAAAILSVLEDPALGRRLRDAGRQHVLSEFPVERMLRDTEALYVRASMRKGSG